MPQFCCDAAVQLFLKLCTVLCTFLARYVTTFSPPFHDFRDRNIFYRMHINLIIKIRATPFTMKFSMRRWTLGNGDGRWERWWTVGTIMDSKNGRKRKIRKETKWNGTLYVVTGW